MLTNFNRYFISVFLLLSLVTGVIRAADFPKTVLIRPFGDSITYGLGFSDWGLCYVPSINQFLCMPPSNVGGGYRGWMTLFSIQGDGIIFTTEGYQSGGSNAQQWLVNTENHDGYPGWTNTQLASKAILPSFANITLVHSGTNDIFQGKDPIAAAHDLETVIKNLLKANKNVHLYIAQIIHFNPGVLIPLNEKHYTLDQLNGNIDTYNKFMPGILNQLSPSDQKRVTFVDISNVLDTHDYSPDGVHPNWMGYAKMACTWIKAVKGEKQTPDNPCSNISNEEAVKKMKPSDEEIKRMTPPQDILEQLVRKK